MDRALARQALQQLGQTGVRIADGQTVHSASHHGQQGGIGLGAAEPCPEQPFNLCISTGSSGAC